MQWRTTREGFGSGQKGHRNGEERRMGVYCGLAKTGVMGLLMCIKR